MLLRTQLCHVSSNLYNSSSNSTCQVRSTTALPQSLQWTATRSNSKAASRTGFHTSSSSSSSTNSRLTRSAGVICRDAPRPMWAAKTPLPDSPSAGAGGDLVRMITRDVAKSGSLAALSDVYVEWGGSFDYIHAAAAINKYAKLKRGRGGDTQLLHTLLRCWMQQLPLAKEQACANVLWALGKLGEECGEVWDATFAAFMNLLQVDRLGSTQTISNTLWACAKLRKQPAPDQLQLLMQTLLLPEMLAAAETQHLGNVVWALGKLCQKSGWQGGVSEADIQQLLGPQQVQLLSATGKAQELSNVMMGLTDMAMAEPPVISLACAQLCSRQLLHDSSQRLTAGNNLQAICNTLMACGQLGLADAPILAASASVAASWVPTSLAINICQATTACVQLQFRHEGLMSALLQRAAQLLQGTTQQGRQQGRAQQNDDAMLGIMCSAVARLDMQQLAPIALQLVESSGIHQRPGTHRANLNRLWVFHSWLLQQQLLDGQGLTGLLTEQQLQQGKQEATLHPDFV